MGARKRLRAEAIKEAKKSQYFAELRNCPTSPRKMRLVVDIIRGKEVNNVLDILRFTQKESAKRVERLLKSAIDNWQKKNPGVRMEDNTLIVKTAFVNEGRQLKRIQPAPQGRAHRVRKRSNHVTLVVDTLNTETKA